MSLREHEHNFFSDINKLWRISVPSLSEPLALGGEWLLEWGGAQRWLKTTESNQHVRDIVSKVGGHATLFRGADQDDEIFHPLSVGLDHLHVTLKNAFDPKMILNRGRMYKNI